MKKILDKRIQECRFEGDYPEHKDEWGLSDTFSETKIKKRASELGIEEDEIRKYLERNDGVGKLLRTMFYKQPITQSYTERMAADYIKKIEVVKEFVDLEKGGHSSKHVKTGKVISNEENEKLKIPEKLDSSYRSVAKSIDFEFIYGKYHVYVSQKYTNEGGGGQRDFQKELGTFLDEAKEPTISTNLFLAIADGALNTEGEYWKDLGDKKQSFVMGIEVLEHFLKEHFN